MLFIYSFSAVPPPALYIQLHGLMLYIAAQSVLWLNYFMLDLSHHLQQFAAVTSIVNNEAGEHRDVRLDGFNLKVSHLLLCRLLFLSFFSLI